MKTISPLTCWKNILVTFLITLNTGKIFIIHAPKLNIFVNKFPSNSLEGRDIIHLN